MRQARAFIDRKIAEGSLIRLSHGTVAPAEEVWVLLLGGEEAVTAAEYDPVRHGPLAHCWNCKQPTEACVWYLSPELGPGRCCDSCQHESIEAPDE